MTQSTSTSGTTQQPWPNQLRAKESPFPSVPLSRTFPYMASEPANPRCPRLGLHASQHQIIPSAPPSVTDALLLAGHPWCREMHLGPSQWLVTGNFHEFLVLRLDSWESHILGVHVQSIPNMDPMAKCWRHYKNSHLRGSSNSNLFLKTLKLICAPTNFNIGVPYRYTLSYSSLILCSKPLTRLLVPKIYKNFYSRLTAR